jgi:hypothetical protein
MSENRKPINGSAVDEALDDWRLLLATVGSGFVNIVAVILCRESHGVIVVLALSCLGWLLISLGLIIGRIFIHRCSWLTVVIAAIIAAAAALANGYFFEDIAWRLE